MPTTTPTGITLPPLEQHPTTACSDRRPGAKVTMVVIHRWGVAAWQTERIQGVINYFENPDNQVSSHLVYAGEQGPDAGRCAQMVPLAKKAWTEASFNSAGVSVESSDRMWQGDDLAGLHRLARIVGWLLHHHGLPPAALEGDAVLSGHGFVRHGALGINGGGHPACPVSSPTAPRWTLFRSLVKHEYDRGGYRKTWAL